MNVAVGCFINHAKGLDQSPFFAEVAFPTGVLGPVEWSQGRQSWIAAECLRLRSGVQPVLAYSESALAIQLIPSGQLHCNLADIR